MKIFAALLMLLIVGQVCGQDLAALFPPRQESEACFARRLDAQVFLPEKSSAYEILAAAAAVNRLCQERLSVPDEFYTTSFPGHSGLVILPRETPRPNDPLPVQIRKRIQELTPNQALVFVEKIQNQTLLYIVGQGKNLEQAATIFFSRYPFLSELLGPEVSTDFKKIKAGLLSATGKSHRIRGLVYEFPIQTGLKSLRLDQFRFNPFAIVRVIAECEPADPLVNEKILRLIQLRSRGEQTDTLSYAEAQALELVNGPSRLVLKRSGYTLAELTPAFKPFLKNRTKSYTGRLEEALTLKGIFADANEDGIPDSLKSLVIVNEKEVTPELIRLSGLLSSHMAGTSFPLLKLDSEIEDISQLDFPVLYGSHNRFLEELRKKGKITATETQASLLRVLNNGLGDYPLLLVTDQAALNFFLDHLQTFGDFNWGGPLLKNSLLNFRDTFTAKRGGDAWYFLSQVERQKPAACSARFSDFLSREKIRELFPPALTKFERSSDPQPVKEWELKLPSEEKRLLNKLEKEVLPEIRASSARTLEIRMSESPATRARSEHRIREWFSQKGIPDLEVQINCSYKFAFFYIWERFLPRLKDQKVERIIVRFPLLKEDFNKAKRFYQDPLRWLYELYPLDAVVAKELGLDSRQLLELEADPTLDNEYRLEAVGPKGIIASDRIRIYPSQRPYLSPLPGWGEVTVAGGAILANKPGGSNRRWEFKTDLELFWDFYQKEVLSYLLDHVNRKTNHNPKLDNQPFFQQLKVSVDCSEPDLRLGVDEETVSSLEALHDEIYFDTLDFLAGILHIEKSDQQFNMRKSSPGNVLPVIKTSNEGQGALFQVSLTDSPDAPQLSWSEEGREIKKTLPDLAKSLKVELDAIQIAGPVARARIRLSADKESDFVDAAAILEALAGQVERKRFAYQDELFSAIQAELKWGESARSFTVACQPPPYAPASFSAPVPEKILSPEMVGAAAAALGRQPGFNVFRAGESLQGRPLPALFVCAGDLGRYSLNKLLVERPTLFFSARQHANEVSSTTYLLKVLEKLGGDPAYTAYLQKFNVLALPLENPDGSELAYELQKLTPNHSLHAGRYTALGVDVGYVQDEDEPSLPEARVRPLLLGVFKPDLYLNLHGYPSHEWVQQFSGYIPFLFRNYWIPKGMFLYYTYVNSPERERFQKTGSQLLQFLGEGLTAISDNPKFYDRYRFWATRWAPHLNELDRAGPSVIYHKRENAGARRYPAAPVTLASETPELMDETAQNGWLAGLLRQGETYLKLHFDFFARLHHEYLTDHYQADERVILARKRLRPGTFPEH